MFTNIKINLLTICTGLLVFFFISPAFAHYPWLNLSDYSPKKGAKIAGTIGWGHHYPLDGFMKQDELTSIKATGPGNTPMEVSFSSPLEWETSEGISNDGNYIVSAERKPGFYTKTAQGGKPVSKKGLEGVISCNFSHPSMKAIASLGTGGNVATKASLPLEIIPLDDPGALRVGDYLHLQVLFQGKPYSGEVYATYAGFSSDSGTYAYFTSTDKEGHARIRILQPGPWLIRSENKTAHPHPEECDFETYSTTLTFEIQ